MHLNLPILRTLVKESDRLTSVDKLFGISYVLRLEPTVFSMAEHIAPDYTGAYWHFYTLSNGAFYMAPRLNSHLKASCDNGFEGHLSADALGVTACLYAYSHLSFGDDRLAETCTEQYHLLRDYALTMKEAGNILRAID